MERSEESENGSSSHQNKMWKQFQAKAKPLLSPKLGARASDEKKERGMWMFKRKKKKHQFLDRVISSSQPDLIFSAPAGFDAQESPLCGKTDPDRADPGSSRSGVAVEGLPSPTHRFISGMGSQKPTVAQLVQSHHKSSSLGSACLERLVEPADRGEGATAAAKTQLEKDDQVGRLYYFINLWQALQVQGAVCFKMCYVDSLQVRTVQMLIPSQCSRLF